MKRLAACLLSPFLFAAMLHAGDAEIIAALKSKGAKTIEVKGAVTGLSFADCTMLTAADYGQIRQLTGMKELGFAKGFDDAALKALGAPAGVEKLSTNGMDISDETFATLAAWKDLKAIAIFHPGAKFTGKGLAALATLPKFENLTVAGSTAFADDGIAAVAKITQLKAFRTWHSGVTTDGVKQMVTLKNLTSLWLGQRLSNTPPVTVSDAVLPILAELPLLESLTLSEARLTSSALGQLKKLTHLKTLTLTGIEISESDIAALKQQLPKTDVKWTAPDEGSKKRIDSLFK